MIFTSALCFGLFLQSPASKPEQSPSPTVTPLVVLTSWEIHDGPSTTAASKLNEEAALRGGILLDKTGNIATFQFDSEQSARRFLARIEGFPELTNAEFSRNFSLLSAPSDPWFPAQGNLQTIRAPESWTLLPADAKAVPVAVIDTGICKAHPEFAGKILSGSMDFSGGPFGDGPNSSVVYDYNGHGTHVAGIIAAKANNGEGIAGVSPNAQILPYQVFQALGASTISIVKAVHHARLLLASTPAKVMNFSLGGTQCTMGQDADFFAEAVQAAIDENFVVIAAAGNGQSCAGQDLNCGSDAIVYPAYFDDVVSVANTTNWDDKQPASQWGWVDVAAPGHMVLSTYPGTNWFAPCNSFGYQQLTGTSMSSPTVAGIAAMLFAVPGVETNAQVRNLIFQSCVPAPLAANNPCAIPNPWVKYGRVDALNAMEAAYGLNQTPGIFGKPTIVKVQGQTPWSDGYFAQLPFISDKDLNLKVPSEQQMALHTLALPNDSEQLLIKSVKKNDSQKARLYLKASSNTESPGTKIRLKARAAVKAGDGKPRRLAVRMFRYDKESWTPEVFFDLPADESYQDLAFEFTQNLEKLVSPNGTMRFRLEGKWVQDSSQEKHFSIRLDHAKVEFE